MGVGVPLGEEVCDIPPSVVAVGRGVDVLAALGVGVGCFAAVGEGALVGEGGLILVGEGAVWDRVAIGFDAGGSRSKVGVAPRVI
ncbi:MAG: hypothetical protein HYY30_11635 [Chloroflexi bacterium]|nr:hypothetical protein [Chloroflexota bacterium]